MIKEPPKGIKTVQAQPLLLFGMDNIARAFRVSRETVKRWYSEGAPIKLVNGMYRAETLTLWNWLPDDRNTTRGGGEP